MTPSPKTIAVLYPGEMGTALASLLSSRGARVVTTLQGRGAKSTQRCRAAGISVLPTLQAVVGAADLVISAVTPSAAQDVADSYCRLAHQAPKNALYLDVNSIGPDLVETMAGGFAHHGVGFVDGAINGLARNLATTATLFISGPRCGEISAILGDSLRVSALGSEIGQASAMKMLLSGVSKGLCALFVEIALTADSRGMLPDFLGACSAIYPGVMGIVDRMLPTYAEHANRRVEEMSQVVATMQAAAVEPCVMAAVLQLHERLAGANLSETAETERSARSLIERLADDAVRPLIRG
ncbi:MAG TPA: DUF1932 domain-containing protein [Tepidisphaeraceae bacterium]|nr:DUF1932 domain-containing protein [Tepidisphaeraceae bacterium]